MKVVTSSEMQALDRKAIEDCGVPSLSLMERAGEGVVHAMEHAYGPMAGKAVTIVVGKGNNGGDGLVVGRLLMKRGARALVQLLVDPDALQGDALVNFMRYRDLGGTILPPPSPSTASLSDSFADSDLLVDAIFGTGLNAPPKGRFAEAIESINHSGRPVVAVDIPSGLSADTGEILGVAVNASMTVTLALPKRGLFLHHGIDRAGEIVVTDIGIPPAIVDDASIMTNLITGSEVSSRLPVRRFNVHKGTFGHVGVIAGSVGKTGAAALASKAALRTGAGLVTLAIPASLNDILEPVVLEVMTVPVPDIAARAFGQHSLSALVEFASGKQAVAIGPGLGMHPETIGLLHELIPQLSMPLVIDADGLNAMARRLKTLEHRKTATVLTPHPGEMARLLGCQKDHVARNRLDCAVELTQRTGAVVVLKGARTLVADPTGSIGICPTGNSGMATGGTGDALTGIIAGLLAQGLSPSNAARVGVYLHGLAGDIAAAARGKCGLIASDLVECIPAAIHRIPDTPGGSLGQHLAS